MLDLPKRFEDKLTSDLIYLEAIKIPHLRKIILFGSCATGKIKINSDIDILIVTDDIITDRVFKGNLRTELSEPIYGVKTDIVFYTRGSYENANDLFTRQLREYGIVLWEEGDFSEIGKQLLCHRL